MKKGELLLRIKQGLKAELDSVNLYKQAKNNSVDKEVINFFEERIKEEKQHYNYLLRYYKDIDSGYELKELVLNFDKTKRASIFSEDFLKRIGSNNILFSAISTALLLEKNSIDFYKECEKKETNWVLQKFYQTMSKWEKNHYQDLLEIQKESEKYYWSENRFEPL